MSLASQGGTYLLRIHLYAETSLAFGRFRGGQLFTLPVGEYLYIGSALNPRGATSLAPRLLRHATRSGARPPHAIREALCDHFRAIGLGPVSLSPPRSKKLHWNVDHLLDLEAAALVGVYAIRSPARLEADLAHALAADPGTEILSPGLGANDVRGGTHLLRVVGGEGWWEGLGKWLAACYGPKFPVAEENAKKTNIKNR
jgi:Uri superfamily endonuclease